MCHMQHPLKLGKIYDQQNHRASVGLQCFKYGWGLHPNVQPVSTKDLYNQHSLSKFRDNYHHFLSYDLNFVSLDTVT